MNESEKKQYNNYFYFPCICGINNNNKVTVIINVKVSKLHGIILIKFY